MAQRKETKGAHTVLKIHNILKKMNKIITCHNITEVFGQNEYNLLCCKNHPKSIFKFYPSLREKVLFEHLFLTFFSKR